MKGLTFSEQGHSYSLNGKRLISMTTLLKEFGLVDYSMINRDVLEAAANFGKVVHETCALYDMGELESCDPQVEPYLDGWKKFISELRPKFLAIEMPMASRIWGFAGTPDRVYKVSRPGILDIKTGSPIPATDLQTAGYQILAEENLNVKIGERITIKLEAGDYKLIQHKDKNDLNTVKGMLALYRWKLENCSRKESKDGN
jgi:hypothetical protein